MVSVEAMEEAPQAYFAALDRATGGGIGHGYGWD